MRLICNSKSLTKNVLKLNRSTISMNTFPIEAKNSWGGVWHLILFNLWRSKSVYLDDCLFYYVLNIRTKSLLRKMLDLLRKKTSILSASNGSRLNHERIG